MSNVTSGKVALSGGSSAAEKTVTVAGFSGIDQRVCPGVEPSGTKPSAVADVQNFRVLSGGALEKRSGFRHLATLNAPIRAAITLLYAGKEHLFCATKEGVYDYTEEDGIRRILSVASTGSCAAFYRDAYGLCLFTNGQILRVTPSEVRDSAYIPLYLKEHQNTQRVTSADVYEDVNLLTRFVRLTYQFAEYSDYLRLPFTPKSVRSFKVDGKELTGTYTYETDSMGTLVRLPASYPKDHTAEIVCEVPDSVYGENSHPLADVRGVFLARTEGLEDRQHLLLAEKDGGIRWSDPIPEYTPDGIYIPAANFYDPVPDGYPITGFARHFDRILCFTENATYQLVRLLPSPRFRFCNGSIGCSSPTAAATVENAPVTVSDGNLCRFTDTTETSNLDDASPVSDAIGTLGLTGDAYLFFDRTRQELWIRDLGDENGLVRIYRVRTGTWYDFTGIVASGFFSFAGQVGYFGGKSLYLTDEALTADQSPTGAAVPIRALAETHWMGFGDRDPVRRSGSLAISCSTGGGKISVTLTTDTGSVATAVLGKETPSAPGAPALIEYGFTPGRFHFFRVRIVSDGVERVGLYRLSLTGRK